MKSLLFVHDHKIIKIGDEYYSTGGLTNNLFDEYSINFEKINVISRQIELEKYDVNKLTKLNKNKINFYKVSDFNQLKNIYNRNIFFELKKEVIKNDYIIARLPSVTGNIACYFAKKYSKILIIEVVGCAWDTYWNYSGIKGKLCAPLYYFLTRNNIKKAENILYVTENFLQNRYPTNAKNILSCSDVKIDFNDLIIKNRIKKIKKNKKTLLLGSIGGLDNKYKGFDIALKALSLLKIKGINFKYEIVGKGDEKFLKDKIKEYSLEKEIILKGTLKHPVEIFEWLDTVDIYLQPSKAEGLPRALIEAQSRGCVCIGSTAGGIPELLDKDFIHKKNDYKKLFEIIYQNIDKDKMIKNIKKNIKFSSKFDKEKIREKKEIFYKKIKGIKNDR